MASPGSVSDSSGHSTSTDDKSSTLNDAAGPGMSNEGKLRLAEKEHRAVVQSKVIVMLTLVGAAAALGLVTYLLITGDEDDSFRSQVSAAFTLSFRIPRFLRTFSPPIFLSAFCSSMTTRQNLLKSPTQKQRLPSAS
jgi:hypothetical protein